MKTAAAALLGLVTSFSALAQPEPTATARQGVASAVERYANAVACAGVKVSPDDVLMLTAGYPAAPMARYAVLWVGDMTCYGGSGAEKTYLAIATQNTGQYLVQPELSSPVVAFESPVRLVRRVVSHSAKNLVLEGMEYGPGDPQSAPSVPVRFILRRDAKGDWKLADKVFLQNAPGQ
jgi:hypothetical protein